MVWFGYKSLSEHKIKLLRMAAERSLLFYTLYLRQYNFSLFLIFIKQFQSEDRFWKADRFNKHGMSPGPATDPRSRLVTHPL